MPNYPDKVGMVSGATPIGDIELLAQNISTTYVEAEVQAISTKLDALITALKTTLK